MMDLSCNTRVNENGQSTLQRHFIQELTGFFSEVSVIQSILNVLCNNATACVSEVWLQSYSVQKRTYSYYSKHLHEALCPQQPDCIIVHVDETSDTILLLQVKSSSESICPLLHAVTLQLNVKHTGGWIVAQNKESSTLMVFGLLDSYGTVIPQKNPVNSYTFYARSGVVMYSGNDTIFINT